MARLGTTIVAGGVGAALMYTFDPDRGRARRARLRDKLVHAEHELADEARTGLHDLENRGRGFAHDLARVARRDLADDDIIAERVRSRLGRAILHPGAIEVAARDGVVTLRGPVLRAEAGRLVHAVRRVRGVHRVVEEMDLRDDPGNIPALQGARRLGGPNVTPSARLVLVAIGLFLGAWAIRRLL